MLKYIKMTYPPHPLTTLTPTPSLRDESQPYPMKEDTRGEAREADCSLGQFKAASLPLA